MIDLHLDGALALSLVLESIGMNAYSQYLSHSRMLDIRKKCSNTIASWKSEAARSIIYGCCCGDHVHQFSFIRRSHYHHVGQASHVCDIKCSTMGGPICTNQASSIHCKADRNDE